MLSSVRVGTGLKPLMGAAFFFFSFFFFHPYQQNSAELSLLSMGGQKQTNKQKKKTITGTIGLTQGVSLTDGLNKPNVTPTVVRQPNGGPTQVGWDNETHLQDTLWHPGSSLTHP